MVVVVEASFYGDVTKLFAIHDYKPLCKLDALGDNKLHDSTAGFFFEQRTEIMRFQMNHLRYGIRFSRI